MTNLYKIVFSLLFLFLLGITPVNADYYLSSNGKLKENKFSYNEETGEYELLMPSIRERDEYFIIDDTGHYWGITTTSTINNILPVNQLFSLNSGADPFTLDYGYVNVKFILNPDANAESVGGTNIPKTIQIKAEGELAVAMYGNWSKNDNEDNDNNWSISLGNKVYYYSYLNLTKDNNGDWIGEVDFDAANWAPNTFKFRYKKLNYGPLETESITLSEDSKKYEGTASKFTDVPTSTNRYFSLMQNTRVYIKFKFSDNADEAEFVLSSKPFTKEVNFSWVDDKNKDLDHDYKVFVYGKENKVQAKVNGAETHEANGLVIYNVKYREPNYKAGEEVNKTPPLSILIDENEENSNGRDDEGYRAANNGTEYSFDETNNFLNLLSAGDYKISISLPEESGFYTTTQPLKVEVAQAETELNIQDLEEPFNSASPTYTWNQAIHFDNPSITESDFTVTIEPDKSEGHWVSQDKYSSSDVNEAYKLALNQDIYRQYQQLTNQQGQNSTPVYIDGFFTELEKPNIVEGTEGTEDTKVFDLTQNFPCSGVYNMTVSPEPSGNFTFTPKTVTITITPHLSTMFGAISGFNINGYGFTGGVTSQIYYPEAEVTLELLKNSVAYKPGTYFDSEFSLTIDGKTYPDSTQPEGKAPNTNWISLDFSALVNKPSVPVKATISKNGAVETLEFIVEKANVPTIIEEIETSEDGEAIFFNMQGLPVLNPSHGLFIKVTNGKASKILL